MNQWTPAIQIVSSPLLFLKFFRQLLFLTAYGNSSFDHFCRSYCVQFFKNSSENLFGIASSILLFFLITAAISHDFISNLTRQILKYSHDRFLWNFYKNFQDFIPIFLGFHPTICPGISPTVSIKNTQIQKNLHHFCCDQNHNILLKSLFLSHMKLVWYMFR